MRLPPAPELGTVIRLAAPWERRVSADHEALIVGSWRILEGQAGSDRPGFTSIRLTRPADRATAHHFADQFGLHDVTELHASTQGMLLALDGLDLTGQRVLEIGTGNGLLAIAAAKRGAQVTAIDNDPGTIEWAASNAQINGVADRITFRHQALGDLSSEPVDLIIANMPPNMLESALMPAVKPRSSPAGRCIR
jgi:ribosomal protein L11 methylase PrmA